MTAHPHQGSSGLGRLLDLPVVRASLPEATPTQVARDQRGPDKGPSRASQPSQGPSVLTEAETRFLGAVKASPGEASSTLPKQTGMSTRRCLALRESLVERGLLRTHHVSRAGKGRTAIVLEVTEAGFAALQRAGGVP